MHKTIQFTDKLFTVEQTRNLEQLIIQQTISGFTLMQLAADAIFTSILSEYKNEKELTIFTGCGNNAGDGLLLACIAQRHNYKVTVIQVTPANRLRGDAFLAYQQFLLHQIKIIDFDPNLVITSGIIVDAILGIGCNKPLEGDILEAVKFINQSSLLVCAIDIPTGLNADTGDIYNLAIKADLTITLICQKLGLFSLNGPDIVGKLILQPLIKSDEIVKILATQAYTAIKITANNLTFLPPRQRNCHKGMFGHLLIIGGNDGMVGAPILTALTAIRSGVGLVSLASKQHYTEQINLIYPEIMTIADTKLIQQDITKFSVIAIGPGLGSDTWQQDLTNFILEQTKEHIIPQVWDADALNWLAQQPTEIQTKLSTIPNLVLTPHPAEAARLLKIPTQQVQQDRIKAIKSLVDKFNAVVLLKGIGSLVCAPNTPVYFCDRGHPAMAGAGFGDVLTGLIASFLAQGLTALNACKLAVWLHAIAGEECGQQGRGVLASDLIVTIRQNLQKYSPILLK